MDSIGVLALQGAFQKHKKALEDLGCNVQEVRTPAELAAVRGLVIPGGESTVISKMMVKSGLLEPLKEGIRQGLPLFGTCAGLILLANHIEGERDLPRPGGLDLQVRRNAYGRQIDSFEAPLIITPPQGEPFKTEGLFIRAPQILPETLGPGVEVLSSFENRAVVVKQRNLLAATFHPELGPDRQLHRLFLEMTF